MKSEFTSEQTDFIERMVRDEVEKVMSPHKGAMLNARLGEEYRAVARQHGGDRDFDATMAEALNRVGESNGELSIIEAYRQVSDSSASRRKNEHLPQPLRAGKKAAGSLGKLMAFNQGNPLPQPFGKKQ